MPVAIFNLGKQIICWFSFHFNFLFAATNFLRSESIPKRFRRQSNFSLNCPLVFEVNSILQSALRVNETLIIVPTYNERENLPRMAQRLLSLPVAVDLLVV